MVQSSPGAPPAAPRSSSSSLSSSVSAAGRSASPRKSRSPSPVLRKKQESLKEANEVPAPLANFFEEEMEDQSSSSFGEIEEKEKESVSKDKKKEKAVIVKLDNNARPVDRLTTLQSFSGSWSLDENLAQALNISFNLIKDVPPGYDYFCFQIMLTF